MREKVTPPEIVAPSARVQKARLRIMGTAMASPLYTIILRVVRNRNAEQQCAVVINASKTNHQNHIGKCVEAARESNRSR